MQIDVAARPGGTVCPYCRESLPLLEAWRCPGCALGLHGECRAALLTCPAVGCAVECAAFVPPLESEAARRERFDVLLAMALVDGELDDAEAAALAPLAERLGFGQLELTGRIASLRRRAEALVLTAAEAPADPAVEGLFEDLLAVARIDGRVEGAERALLQRLGARLGRDPERLSARLQAGIGPGREPSPEQSLGGREGRLEDRFAALLQMAAVDGVLDPEERARLWPLGEALGLSEEAFEGRLREAFGAGGEGSRLASFVKSEALFEELVELALADDLVRAGEMELLLEAGEALGYPAKKTRVLVARARAAEPEPEVAPLPPLELATPELEEAGSSDPVIPHIEPVAPPPTALSRLVDKALGVAWVLFLVCLVHAGLPTDRDRVEGVRARFWLGGLTAGDARALALPSALEARRLTVFLRYTQGSSARSLGSLRVELIRRRGADVIGRWTVSEREFRGRRLSYQLYTNVTTAEVEVGGFARPTDLDHRLEVTVLRGEVPSALGATLVLAERPSFASRLRMALDLRHRASLGALAWGESFFTFLCVWVTGGVALGLLSVRQQKRAGTWRPSEDPGGCGGCGGCGV